MGKRRKYIAACCACDSIPRATLEACRAAHIKMRRQPRLRQLVWQATLACDLTCAHCFARFERSRQVRGSELNNIFANIAAGCDPPQVNVGITGGEPTSRRDLVHAIAELRRLGFASVGISSNGLRLGQEPELLDALVQAGMDGLNLSLDGPEAYHNQVRGNAQAYAHVVSTLQRARSKHPQLGLSLTVVVSAHNFDSYQHVADLAEQYGVHTLKVVGVIPQGRAQSLDTYVLQDAQLLALLEHVQRMRTEHALGQRRCDVTFTDDGFVACFEGRVRNGLFQCPAGVSVATLWHDGRLAACPQLSLEANFQGDLRHHNFAELWQGGFAPFRKREWLKQGPCRSCPDWRYCMGGSLHDRDEQGRLLRCNALAIRRAKRDRNEHP